MVRIERDFGYDFGVFAKNGTFYDLEIISKEGLRICAHKEIMFAYQGNYSGFFITYMT